MALPKTFVRKEVYQTAAGWVKQFSDGSVSDVYKTEKEAQNAKKKPAVAAKIPVSEEEAEAVKVASTPKKVQASKE